MPADIKMKNEDEEKRFKKASFFRLNNDFLDQNQTSLFIIWLIK